MVSVLSADSARKQHQPQHKRCQWSDLYNWNSVHGQRTLRVLGRLAVTYKNADGECQAGHTPRRIWCNWSCVCSVSLQDSLLEQQAWGQGTEFWSEVPKGKPGRWSRNDHELLLCHPQLEAALQCCILEVQGGPLRGCPWDCWGTLASLLLARVMSSSAHSACAAARSPPTELLPKAESFRVACASLAGCCPLFLMPDRLCAAEGSVSSAMLLPANIPRLPLVSSCPPPPACP